MTALSVKVAESVLLMAGESAVCNWTQDASLWHICMDEFFIGFCFSKLRCVAVDQETAREGPLNTSFKNIIYSFWASHAKTPHKKCTGENRVCGLLKIYPRKRLDLQDSEVGIITRISKKRYGNRLSRSWDLAVPVSRVYFNVYRLLRQGILICDFFLF